jgi:hypothetical protein
MLDQTRAGQVTKACPTIGPAGAPTPESSRSNAEGASQLAKKTQNPIGELISIQLQNNTNFGFGPLQGTQEVLNIRPVIPIHVTPDWNIIARKILPLVLSTSPSSVRTVPFGMAPISFSTFLSPSKLRSGRLWGIGPVVQVPTISSSRWDSNVWGGEPTTVIVYISPHVVAGALANDIWSFEGTDGPGGNSSETFLTQPFFGTSPPITNRQQSSCMT